MGSYKFDEHCLPLVIHGAYYPVTIPLYVEHDSIGHERDMLAGKSPSVVVRSHDPEGAETIGCHFFQSI